MRCLDDKRYAKLSPFTVLLGLKWVLVVIRDIGKLDIEQKLEM